MLQEPDSNTAAQPAEPHQNATTNSAPETAAESQKSAENSATERKEAPSQTAAEPAKPANADTQAATQNTAAETPPAQTEEPSAQTETPLQEAFVADTTATLPLERTQTVVEVDSWKNGIEPTPRFDRVSENSWLVTTLLLMVVLVSFNIRNLRRIIKTFPQDLLGGSRRASNSFDEHTSNEQRTFGLMILLLCLFEGSIMLRHAIGKGILLENSPDLLGTSFLFMGLALAFYLGRLALYSLVGFVFTNTDTMIQWRRGFNASQTLLCIFLVLPATVALFSPKMANLMTIIALIAFFACQLLFIANSFRIFFNNFASSLYFILYLCALEITPIFIAIAGYNQIISDFLN